MMRPPDWLLLSLILYGAAVAIGAVGFALCEFWRTPMPLWALIPLTVWLLLSATMVGAIVFYVFTV